MKIKMKRNLIGVLEGHTNPRRGQVISTNDVMAQRLCRWGYATPDLRAELPDNGLPEESVADMLTLIDGGIVYHPPTPTNIGRHGYVHSNGNGVW
ncbi:hypothetical protein [Mycolicibacterium sp. CBMA 226]|uniref:hypothetical protein n=1 Tax=Mycolicibacterium sp. CBMA 226 TaxID=2606611 RepID=UPI0012DCB73E|nr:hypothetical protein [Mycolicibacterium sp. CBMA 226]MUL75710.1 hypothetical protein [Mycolicibacterium sp. CBMA 226]